MQSGTSSGFEGEMRRLDVGLRRLKVQYDMFFAGSLDREPTELREQLRRIIRKYSAEPPNAYAQQFLLQSLVSRFNCMTELWGKTLRAREQGDRRTPSLAERAGIRERLLSRCVVTEARQEDDELRRVHARFVEASRRHGATEVPYERFVRGVAAQAKKLRQKSKCGQIELRVVEMDDGVQVKARPGKTRAGGE